MESVIRIIFFFILAVPSITGFYYILIWNPRWNQGLKIKIAYFLAVVVFASSYWKGNAIPTIIAVIVMGFLFVWEADT